MYQFSNDEDEFEPRSTPKPASKLDCLAVPSVPEVSLVFDKPSNRKITDRADYYTSPAQTKDFIQRDNVLPPSNINGSYAAWKDQKYSYKPTFSKVKDCTVPQKVQSNQQYIVHSYLDENSTKDILNESREERYAPRKDIYNGLQCEEEIRKGVDYSNKYHYDMPEVNVIPTKRRQSINAQSSKPVRHIEPVPHVQHVLKPCTSSDNYIFNKSEHSPLSYERTVSSNCPRQQKVAFSDSVTEQSIENLPLNPSNLQRNEFQLPHYVGQQYPYFNVNAYPFPQLPPYQIQSTENQETVKNLLQIINSQNEQIKSLQVQVDRLLKIQEETLRERKRCSCLLQMQQQNDQLHTNLSDTMSTTNHVSIIQNPNQRLHQNKNPNDNIEHYNENKDGNINEGELILPDALTKKKIMEQKVSIGVMTSFEFTVQNTPLAVDNAERKDDHQNQEPIKVCNTGGGFRDATESLRRYKNSFTRVPSAHLENIVEDTESYMSSSQQQSSNLNATTSTKDLEKQVYTEIRKDTDTYRSRSPKFSKDVTAKFNETEICRAKRFERSTVEGARNCEMLKTPIIQRNVTSTEYNSTEDINYKPNTPLNIHQYKNQNVQRGNDPAKGSNSANSSEYCKEYKKDGEINETKRVNCVEDSLILNGGDLKINERPPSPEPSIHVEMQEYSSDDDSDKLKRSSKVGWTFYNNVLGQVNQLLQNSSIVDDQQQHQGKANTSERDETENKAVLDTVKVATLEQLKKLGISLSENPEAKELNKTNKMGFDLSFYPRLDYQANMTQATSAVNETNTSMHMKALALKYLTDEQLAELAVQRQGSTSLKHLMVSNVQGTNMSFATMRYLERYQLLPGKNNAQAEDVGKVQDELTPQMDLNFVDPKNSPKTLQRLPFSQTSKTTCPSKILDISTLKQQPKLL